MPDRITQLERLNRLRAEGGLSEDEFEREKKKLLERRMKPALLAGIGAGVAAVILLAVLLWFQRSGLEVRNKEASAASNAATPITVSAPPLPDRPARPAPLDLSGRLSFAGGDCRFSPAIDRAFPRLLHWDESRRTYRPRTVQLGSMSLTPRLSASPPQGDEGRLYQSSVRLTQPTRWNGLSLLELRASTGFEFGDQQLVFAESAGVVRDRLRAMGVSLPAPPAYRTIPTDGCQASIGVETRRQGSALVCTGWC